MRKLFLLLMMLGLVVGLTSATQASTDDEKRLGTFLAFNDDEDDYDEEGWEEIDDEEDYDDEWDEDYDEEEDWDDEDYDGEDYEEGDFEDDDYEYGEFDLEAEKQDMSEWLSELLEELDEENSAYASEIQSIKNELDSVNNEDKLFDLIDRVIEIEEEVFDFDDMYEGEYEDDFEIDEEWIDELKTELQAIADLTGEDLSAQIDALAALESDDHEGLDAIFDAVDSIIGEENVDVESYYTGLWIDELQEIFLEEGLEAQLTELDSIRQALSDASNFDALDRVHTQLIQLEQDVFDEIDYEDEDFDIEEGKMWAGEWIDEMIQYLRETEGSSENIADLETLKSELDGVKSHEELYELEDKIIAIEESMDWDEYEDFDEDYDDVDFEEEQEFAQEVLSAIIDMAKQDDNDTLVQGLEDLLADVRNAQDVESLFALEDRFWEMGEEVETYLDRYFEDFEDEDDEDFYDDLDSEDLEEWSGYIDEFLSEIGDEYDVSSLQDSLKRLDDSIRSASQDDVPAITETLINIEDSIDALLESLGD